MKGPSSVALVLLLYTSSVAGLHVSALRRRTWTGMRVQMLSARGNIAIIAKRSSTLLLPLLSCPSMTSCGGCH
eukprot:CAMPEP_0173410708 /NCGR_PEP_ID=MMETSP1356-20130122/75236_1 /TAXON_ID=77927 ORGANISM="Hemiselmis virescens, Strain PCC157" /NCGR_SAMPLE_ID=MMETSP1356 /ASSEMBLY_ACC=CAM_ASM_000847 /LENGTH=72 /DNA_ID=CAMNT_0014372359 /DNA_START=29 /DNA_END=244 /DNA_ORIENTATION=-